MFRVVPDQLKISDGWVRCGHCQEVFDAQAHLQQAEPVPAPTVLAADPPQPQVEPLDEPDAPTVPADIAPPTVPQPLRPVQAPEPERIAGASAFGHSQMEVIEVESPYSEFPSSMQQHAVEPHEHEMVGTEPGRLSGIDSGRDSQRDSLRDPADSAGYPPFDFQRERGRVSLPSGIDDVDSEVPSSQFKESELDHVSFVRQARRKAFWQRPLVRFALLLVALALAALLAAQYALHERDRLAAMHPQYAQLLDQLCQPVGCRVGPPHRIDAIAIDSSGFTRLRGDTYRLSFTLKNTAAQPVAMPALQLTLTDTSDQAVMQRVLLPAELGAPSPTLAASGEWTSSIALAVNNGGGARVAGYRLLAFYP
jgi:predicted Zn finger-like uncharacterized protein